MCWNCICFFSFQFFDRMLIIFMPQKYQPDYTFLRSVPTYKVHIFTFVQFSCLLMLWIIKSYKPTSIAFPLMVCRILLPLMLFQICNKFSNCMYFIWSRTWKTIALIPHRFCFSLSWWLAFESSWISYLPKESWRFWMM